MHDKLKEAFAVLKHHFKENAEALEHVAYLERLAGPQVQTADDPVPEGPPTEP